MLTPNEGFEYSVPAGALVDEYFWNILGKEYLENKIKSDLGINGFGKIGTWVGKVGNIDIISKNDDDQYLVGYCSYEKQMMSYEDYEWFLYCVKQAKIEPIRIYLCSVASFDEKITLEARMKKNIVLVSMNEFE